MTFITDFFSSSKLTDRCSNWISSYVELLLQISFRVSSSLTDVVIIGYRLHMAKYARPRSLSGKADRACEVCFRSKTEGWHISPYSVYNLFITYFTTEFTFCKLSFWNLKYLKCLTLSWIWLIRLEKIAKRFCWIKTTSKHCGKSMSTYWHQQTINGDCRCCPRALCSGCFDLPAPLCHIYVFGTIQCY